MATILIADDDRDMLETYEALLGARAHAVRTTLNPRELLRWVARQEVEPDLIVLDNHMPGMTGLELAEALREIGYQGPILLASGDDLGQPTHVSEMLHKPFGIEELTAAVDRLIAA